MPPTHTQTHTHLYIRGLEEIGKRERERERERERGLHHNWDMHNAFVFDGGHGVKAYIRNLKGVLM